MRQAGGPAGMAETGIEVFCCSAHRHEHLKDAPLGHLSKLRQATEDPRGVSGVGRARFHPWDIVRVAVAVGGGIREH